MAAILPDRLSNVFHIAGLSKNKIMRCYFLKQGRIAAVELLSQTTDEGRIAEARELFTLKGVPRGAEGFEVWDRARFIYRYPEEP